MKIFFIVKNHFPNGLATTARVINYCKGFIESGVNCEVIIPVAMERYEEPLKNTKYKGVYNGIPYQYISKCTRRSKYLLYRKFKDVVDYIATLVYLFKHVTVKDVILVYEGGNVWFFCLAILSHLKRSHIVMELNELPYGTGVETKHIIKKRRWMLNHVFHLFDGFLAISDTLVELVKKYAPKSSVLKVPIIVDTSISKNVIDFYPQRPFLFHSGSLYEQKDGIKGILEAFAIANAKLGYKLDYFFTGNPKKSRDYNIIKETIEKYSLSKYVHFLGYINNEELRAYQKNSLAFIINKNETLQNKYCFSTKLGEYLSFSKPIIITNVGEAMNYLNESNAYIVAPNSPQLMAEKIIEIVNNPNEALYKGHKGYKIANDIFNYKYQGKKMISFFKDMLSDKV